MHQLYMTEKGGLLFHIAQFYLILRPYLGKESGMNNRVCLLTLVIVSALLFSLQPVRAEDGVTKHFLYLPAVSSEAWTYGAEIIIENYDDAEHFTVRMNAPESYTCSDLEFRWIFGFWRNVESGHWRDYPEPTEWGPTYYQLTKTFIYTHPGSKDFNNYRASCVEP